MFRTLLKRAWARYYHSQRRVLRSEELGEPLKRKNGCVSLREYIKWNNKPRVMQANSFFNKTQNTTRSQLMDLEPIFTQCMAKWLWVNYKMNDFPYFDLNIVNVFTDLSQSVKFCDNTMRFFRDTLHDDYFKRINYTLVPLYRMKDDITGDLVKQIPGNVNIINDITVSPFKKPYRESSNDTTWILDPVYVLLLNDVVGNTAHDLVRMGSQGWEQAQLSFDNNGLYCSRRFTREVDTLCSRTVQLLQEELEDSLQHGKEFYIPSQMVQLLDVLKSLTPEYRMFVIDRAPPPPPLASMQFWSQKLFSMLKYSPEEDPSGARPAAAPIQENSQYQLGDTSKPFQAIDHTVRFIPNWGHLERLVFALNDTCSPYELEELPQFVETWMDKQAIDNSLHRRLSRRLGDSNLLLLHST